MADWGQNDKVVQDNSWGQNDAVVGTRPAPKPKAPKEEVASKKESFIRGAVQGATFGFGDEIQSLIRSLSPIQVNATENGYPTLGLNQDFGEYKKLRDEERAANAASRDENPFSYGAGSVASAIPGGIAGLGKTALASAGKSALVGGAQGLGTSDADTVGGMALDAGQGAAIQGALGGTLTGVGNLATKGASALGEMSLKATKLPASMVGGKPYLDAAAKAARNGTATAEQLKNLQMVTGPLATEGVKSPFAEGVKGAAKGAINAYRGTGGGMGTVASVLAAGPAGLALPAVVGGIGGAAKGVGAASAKSLAAGGSGAVLANVGAGAAKTATTTALALQQMTGQDAKKINDDARAKIDERVANGQPVYAATFSALNASPAYRVASEKVAAEEDDEEDDQDDDYDE